MEDLQERFFFFFFKVEDVSGRSGFDLTFVLEEVFCYAECSKSMRNSKLPPDLCSPCPAMLTMHLSSADAVSYRTCREKACLTKHKKTQVFL